MSLGTVNQSQIEKMPIDRHLIVKHIKNYFTTDILYLEICSYCHWIHLDEMILMSCISSFYDYWMQNKLVKIYFLIFLL